VTLGKGGKGPQDLPGFSGYPDGVPVHDNGHAQISLPYLTLLRSSLALKTAEFPTPRRASTGNPGQDRPTGK